MTSTATIVSKPFGFLESTTTTPYTFGASTGPIKTGFGKHTFDSETKLDTVNVFGVAAKAGSFSVKNTSITKKEYLRAQMDHIDAEESWENAQREFEQAKNIWKTFKSQPCDNRVEYIKAKKIYIQAEMSYLEAEEEWLEAEEDLKEVEDAYMNKN